jgi:hypothetical protein
MTTASVRGWVMLCSPFLARGNVREGNAHNGRGRQTAWDKVACQYYQKMIGGLCMTASILPKQSTPVSHRKHRTEVDERWKTTKRWLPSHTLLRKFQSTMLLASANTPASNSLIPRIAARGSANDRSNPSAPASEVCTRRSSSVSLASLTSIEKKGVPTSAFASSSGGMAALYSFARGSLNPRKTIGAPLNLAASRMGRSTVGIAPSVGPCPKYGLGPKKCST